DFVRRLHLVTPEPEPGQYQRAAAGHRHPGPEHRQQKQVAAQTERAENETYDGITGAQLYAAKNVKCRDEDGRNHGALLAAHRPEHHVHCHNEGNYGGDQPQITQGDPATCATVHRQTDADGARATQQHTPQGQCLRGEAEGQCEADSIRQTPEEQLAGFGPVVLKTGRTMADQVNIPEGLGGLFGGGQHGVDPFLIINCKELYYAEKTIAISVSGKITTPGRPAAA